MNYHKKIIPVDQLREIVQRAQAEGKVVVQCHGCFDILHPGHLRHLAWAKGQGDILIVSVSADKVVNKGFLRPYVPEGLRAENLAALEMVDYVSIMPLGRNRPESEYFLIKQREFLPIACN